MKRRTLLLSLLGAAVVAGVGSYLYLIKFDIRREQMVLHDASRNRDVPVELSISRRAELKAILLRIKPRVAIVNHGNTVKNTEYSFVGDVLATQGYLVAAIQHDLPGDPPLSMQGFPFVGRLPSYQRAEKNILFAIGEIKKVYPDPDFESVTLFGHSQGGDIAMYFAGQHPDKVTKVVTLDNIRVPILMSGRQRILSFRSNNFKADPGVVPTADTAEDAGIEVVHTEFQHDHFRDSGPDTVKAKVQEVLARFLSEDKPPKKPFWQRRQKPQQPEPTAVSVNYTPQQSAATSPTR
jgi:hypothetical protein